MDFRAIELTFMRMYKPWYHLDFVFSIYLRLIGQHDIYEKIKILPNKVSVFLMRKLIVQIMIILNLR